MRYRGLVRTIMKRGRSSGSSKKADKDSSDKKARSADGNVDGQRNYDATHFCVDYKRRKDNSIIFDDFPEFQPRLLPREIFEAGAFGGAYFRPIKSGVTGKSYTNAADEFAEHFKGIPKEKISSKTADVSRNKYGVKAGQTLDAWEEKNWIKAQDPYGWIHWYCRFCINGRRSEDDARQVQRWLNYTGPKGRWRRNLVNKIKAAETSYDDPKISPVVRQGLLQWGWEVQPEDIKQ